MITGMAMLILALSTQPSDQASRGSLPERPPSLPGLQINYPERKALIANLCPTISLSGFSFENRFDRGGASFIQNLAWKNTGSQAVVAFEVVILKYDAFDQRLIGSRWTVTGTNSADWRPLGVGAASEDGTSSHGSEQVFTALAYVRTARLADGTIWQVDEDALLEALKGVAPGLKELGSTKPDSAPGQAKQ